MFEGDSADTYGGKFCSRRWGAEQKVWRAQTRERGPPSARADIPYFLSFLTAYFIDKDV